MPTLYPDRYFFLHVMKTGGSTFRQHIMANFARDEVYPQRGRHGNMIQANLDADHVLSLPADELDRIRVFTGHLPYALRDMLGFETTALTILRDPVARTISYLKHCKRYHPQHRDLSLDQIYDDDFYFTNFIKNFQSKMFCIASSDPKVSGMIALEVDQSRLAIAKKNLAKIHIIGLTEDFSAFLDDVETRLGWKRGEGCERRVSSEAWSVSDSIRERIVADNAADMEFYRYAKELQKKRARNDEAVANS